MAFVQREEFLNKLIAFKDKKLVKIITGIRRCGKSTLMQLFIDYLKEQGVEDNQIISINFEDYDFDNLREPKQLYYYIKERLIDNKMCYIFLDEVQHVEDFSKVVDSLYIKDNIDIYLTGSNAYMLSSEIATLISGRFVEISMLPLSFKEYIDSIGDNTDLNKKYNDYLVNSSFPYTLNLRDLSQDNGSSLVGGFAVQNGLVHDYLDSIYNTIVIKDIATRNKITDIMMLESVTRFMLDNIGNTLSTKKIADTMTSNGRKIDVKTVEKYIRALRESFVLYQAKRFDIKGKQFLKTLEKYYLVDIGLRYTMLGSRNADIGHILENVIYLELIRRGYGVYVGKVDDLEVDFVAIGKGTVKYFQVAATVRDYETFDREIAPLQKIKDSYEKIILTLDDDPVADYDGIKRMNALTWLLAKD